MTRIDVLLTKRKELTITPEEEVELLELLKTAPQEEFNKIDESLLKTSKDKHYKLTDIFKNND